MRVGINRILFPAFLICFVTAVLTANADAETGIASVYSGRTRHADRARDGMSAAHRSLPLGTMVRVTNQKNGSSVMVRINDRGPFIRGRVIDLSSVAARALGFSGLTTVTLAPVLAP